MKRIYLILTFTTLMLLAGLVQISAQGFFVNTDIVTGYLFRGRHYAGISVQPKFGYSAKGFTAYIWGSTDFSKNENEIDLYLEYAYKGLAVSLQDVFVQPEGGQFDYFNYKKGKTTHEYEASIRYCFSERIPITFGWYTRVAGPDFKIAHGPVEREFVDTRRFSSYMELSYSFDVKGFDCRAEIGATPWKGNYADRFAVNNVGFYIGRKIDITSKYALHLFCKAVGNPYENRMYFMGGLTL